MKKLALVFLLACSHLFAADFYIAQTATGSGSGADVSNCKAYTFFTTSTNWNGSAGTICATATKDTVRDTIHLVGTISSALAWPYTTGTGVAGLLIYFEPNAKLSAPTWVGGAINWESAAYAKNNVTIDGGTNGLIECTANGTLLANQVTSTGIKFISASHVTVKNLLISNLYIRVNDSSFDQVDGGSGIYGSTGDGAYTDFTVQDCTIHDVNIAINAPYTNGSNNYSFLRNEIYNINWGIGSGSAGTPTTMSNWLADGNNIHDFANWDAPIGFEAFHHNGIFCFGNSGTDNFQSATIRNNTFGPNFGSRATAGVYLSSYGMQGTFLVYNNIFLGSSSNGLLNIGCGTGSVTRAYNNTIVNNNTASAGCIQIGGVSATSMTVYLENNICSGAMFINGNMVGSVTIHSNHNLAFNYGSSIISWSTTTSAVTTSWATWQGTYAQDANSIQGSDPLLDGSYKLGAGSPAIGVGSDQSAYFTTDKAGLTRTTPFDLGAFKYVASGSDATAPTPNPSTISGTPTHTATSISVTATTSTDATTPPATYSFSSDNGATWTAFQSSASYTFSGLSSSTTYQVKVMAEDSASTPNVTTPSSATAVTTDALAASTSRAHIHRATLR